MVAAVQDRAGYEDGYGGCMIASGHDGTTAPALPPMTVIEQTFADLWATGASPDSHPVQHIREHLRAAGALTTAQMRTAPHGTQLTIGGPVTHRQRPETAKGVVFLSIEDETGLANVVVRPTVWDEHKRIISDHAGLLIDGRIEHANGACNLVATRLRPVVVTTPTRGRDYR